MPWEAISNNRKSLSSDIQILRSWLIETRLRIVFLNHFSVFGYLMKHSSSCLMYYIKYVPEWDICILDASNYWLLDVLLINFALLRTVGCCDSKWSNGWAKLYFQLQLLDRKGKERSTENPYSRKTWSVFSCCAFKNFRATMRLFFQHKNLPKWSDKDKPKLNLLEFAIACACVTRLIFIARLRMRDPKHRQLRKHFHYWRSLLHLCLSCDWCRVSLICSGWQLVTMERVEWVRSRTLRWKQKGSNQILYQSTANRWRKEVSRRFVRGSNLSR